MTAQHDTLFKALASASIPFHTPDSANYTTLLAHYSNDFEPVLPLTIVRPQNAGHVSAIVKACVALGLVFALRSGGHDLAGRSTVSGAVSIDMRDVKHVHIAEDRATAKIGGGILFGELAERLGEAGLYTATGTVASVGFTGWSTLGGYGPLSPSVGFGIDQIVGAQIVDASGDVVEADERVLEGIRGAGGNFGAIVELTIKVYPLTEIQTGLLILDSTDIAKTMSTFFTNLGALVDRNCETIPRELYFQPLVLEIPGQGVTFTLSYTWNGPSTDEEKKWRDEISALAPVVASTIAPGTPSALIASVTAMLVVPVFQGTGHTVSLRGLSVSPSTVEKLARAAQTLPLGSGAVFSLHLVNGKAVAPPFMPSVFRNREAHYMVELIGLATSVDQAKAAGDWAEATLRDLQTAEEAMEATYISLTGKNAINLEKIYGMENLEKLVALKQERDPKNIFRHAVPNLLT